MIERLLAFGVPFLCALLAALFHSPRWWWAVGALLAAGAGCRVLYLRWPWAPPRTVEVGGERYPLAEALDFLKASEFYSLCETHKRAAVKGGKDVMRRLIAEILGSRDVQERRTMTALLHRTVPVCASCGRTMPESFQNLEWMEAAGASYAVLDEAGKPSGNCSRCGSAEFLFVYPAPGGNP